MAANTYQCSFLISYTKRFTLQLVYLYYDYQLGHASRILFVLKGLFISLNFLKLNFFLMLVFYPNFHKITIPWLFFMIFCTVFFTRQARVSICRQPVAMSSTCCYEFLFEQYQKSWQTKGELHSNYIFSLFCFNWPKMEFFNPIYKRNFFSSHTHISTPFAQDIYSLLFTNMNIF